MAGYGNNYLTAEELVDLIEDIHLRSGDVNQELADIGMTLDQIQYAMKIYVTALADASVPYRVSRFSPNLGDEITRSQLYQAVMQKHENPMQSGFLSRSNEMTGLRPPRRPMLFGLGLTIFGVGVLAGLIFVSAVGLNSPEFHQYFPFFMVAYAIGVTLTFLSR